MHRATLIGLLLLISLPQAGYAADFDTGLQSYYRMSFSKALATWRPLAEDGHAKAQYQLGVMYYYGEGVPQNYDRAAEWYGKAAEGGDADAQFNLGLMYAHGIGVEQDFVSAHVWFNLAASVYSRRARETWAIHDPKQAARNRDWSASKLSSAQIAEARRRVLAWRSRKPSPRS